MQVIEKRSHNKTSLVLQNLVDTGGHDAVGCWKSHLQLTIFPRHHKFFVITWRSNIDRGLVNAVVFLDLKKAFDTVDHDILPRKLQYYGICCTSHQWFASYLDSRTQICHLNSCKSTPKYLRCGVPQPTFRDPFCF